MNINFLNNLNKSNYTKNNQYNFHSVPVSFKGGYDTFIKKAAEEFSPEDMLKIKRYASTIRVNQKWVMAKLYAYDLRLYNEQLKKRPATAFLYDPDIPYEDRIKMAKESQDVMSLTDLQKELKIENYALTGWSKSGFLSTDCIREKAGIYRVYDRTFVDVSNEDNKKFLDGIKKQLPNSYPALLISLKYNVTERRFKKMLKSGEIKALGYEEPPENGIGLESLLIDMTDKQNLQSFKKHKKLYPVRSKYAHTVGKTMPRVSVGYLEKMGFGDMRKLANFVQDGILKGTIKKVDTPNGTKTEVLVDQEDIDNEAKLKMIRKNNQQVFDVNTFAKKINMKLSDVQQALLDGELKIIPEFLFNSDYSKSYIDTTNPKNKEFIEKTLFERELTRSKKSSKFTLKMKIVWILCPKTKAIASELAAGNAYLCSLLAKENENAEELTDKENEIIKSYKKCVWEKAGTEEYGRAHKIPLQKA